MKHAFAALNMRVVFLALIGSGVVLLAVFIS